MAFEFYGNEKVAKFLERAVSSGKISHAYLFYGLSGVGKKFIARQFAKALFCSGKDRPCNVCSSCFKFENKNHPDFFEIGEQTENFKKSFSVEDVRKLIENVQIKPNDSCFKIFLLKDVDAILASAANAFLKILENPPSGVVFLLTATSRFNVFETILSRCVLIKIDGLKKSVLTEILREKYKNNSDDELEEVANVCGGSLKRASFFLETSFGQNVLVVSKSLQQAIFEKDELLTVKVMAQFENNLELLLEVFSCLSFKLQIKLEEEIENEEIFHYIIKIDRSIEKARNILKSNGNLKLTAARFCCEIFC